MDPSNTYIAPIHGDYTGCPPVMIQVGSHECLLADSRSVKDALDKAGCVVGYHEWDGMWHVFHMEAKLPETIESFKMFGELNVDSNAAVKISDNSKTTQVSTLKLWNEETNKAKYIKLLSEYIRKFVGDKLELYGTN